MVLNLYSDGSSYEEIAEKMDLKNETYARRKKYLSKEALLEIVKEDPEYQEYLRFLKWSTNTTININIEVRAAIRYLL
mgnify:CR=1 FL=1